MTEHVDILSDIRNGYAEIDGALTPFRERCIVDDLLYITIPADFELMPPEVIEAKYPHEKRPSIIYSNENYTINIAFSLTSDKLTDEGVEDAKSALEEMLTSMPHVSKIISSSVIEEEIKIGYFDFASAAIGEAYYNLMFIFSLDGQVALGSFSCLQSDIEAWSELAEQMLRTIRIVT